MKTISSAASKSVEKLELITDDDFIEFVLAKSGELQFEAGDITTTEVENLSGNINRVRRVRLLFSGGQTRSYIVKQVPYGGNLERYPSIVFPEDRIDFEVSWLEFSNSVWTEPGVRTARVLAYRKEQHSLLMEDLDPCCSLGRFLRENKHRHFCLLARLGAFLGRTHRRSLGLVQADNPSAALNRTFVFTLALAQPARIKAIWEEQAEKEKVSDASGGHAPITLSERFYLQDHYLRDSAHNVLPVLSKLEASFKTGHRLVWTHGDLHTESVLVLSDGQLGVVDAELCDYGTPAFDLGMLCAHIWACGAAAGATKSDVLKGMGGFIAHYVLEFFQAEKPGADELSILLKDTALHCGAEMLRRLLGAAGFAFALSMDQCEELLTDATSLLVAPGQFVSVLLNEMQFISDNYNIR